MTVKILVLLTTLAAAETCQDGNFTAPQPDGTKDLESIPSRLRGRYVSLEDTTVLEITEQVIVRFKTDISSVGEGDVKPEEWEKMHRDTTFCDGNGCYVLKPFGDSVKLTINYADTIIHPGKGTVRKYRKYYFLNVHISENEWDVKKLELDKNGLIMSSIGGDDIEFLRNQLRTSDTTRIFSPTEPQFKQFVKEGGFRSREKFRRQ